MRSIKTASLRASAALVRLALPAFSATATARLWVDIGAALIKPKQLRRQRAAKGAELEAIDTKLEPVTDAGFITNLGRKELAVMTLCERSAVAAKLGHAKFAELVTGRVTGHGGPAE
jgi:hypothetical protein